MHFRYHSGRAWYPLYLRCLFLPRCRFAKKDRMRWRPRAGSRCQNTVARDAARSKAQIVERWSRNRACKSAPVRTASVERYTHRAFQRMRWRLVGAWRESAVSQFVAVLMDGPQSAGGCARASICIHRASVFTMRPQLCSFIKLGGGRGLSATKGPDKSFLPPIERHGVVGISFSVPIRQRHRQLTVRSMICHRFAMSG